MDIYDKEWLFNSGALDKIITNGAISVEGIAVDWEACNIYWTDYILENVEVASCDGKYRKVLFHEGVYNARGIAVDPRNGYVHTSDIPTSHGFDSCLLICCYAFVLAGVNLI